MKRKFSAFQTPRSIYLSIFNSFRVIRCLSQCVSPKIAIFTTFCLPCGRPCGNHAKRCMNEKTIQCLPNPWQHVRVYIQQFPSYSNRKCKKSPFTKASPGETKMWPMPHFCFPWRRLCDYHAMCFMDGKTLFSASQTPRSMYLSIYKLYDA